MPNIESITSEETPEVTKQKNSTSSAEQSTVTVEEVEKLDQPKKEKPIVSKEGFLESFNWNKYQNDINKVEDSELKEFENLINENFVETNNKDVIVGIVTNITGREVIIDVNSKSEGVISINEFRYNPDLKVGDKVEVFVDQREDKTGQLVLSHRKARTIKAWDRSVEAYEKKEIVDGFVKCRTKGGMIVELFGIEVFLPGSQIDVKPITDYDQFIGRTMEFRIVKINQKFKNIVVSHKALIEADLADQRREIIGQLERGQVIEGIIKNITSYGVFVDLGGVDGLIHITDVSWSKISNPADILEISEKIKVVILDFDDNKSRIQLGLKQLGPHPWELLDKDLRVGDKIKGEVVVLADYGAFVEISKNVEALLHVSEMSWSTHLRSAQDFVKIGDEIEAVVLTLDREERKMSIGLKQLKPDPWTGITKKYTIGSKHTGIVRNFTNFGAFLELEEGVDGLIYISDISWTQKINHPSDYMKIGDKLEVVVLDLDVDGRKLSLGHKQTKENPWDKYEGMYAVGTIHEGVVEKIVDKGAIIRFTEDVSAFVPIRFLQKEDEMRLTVRESAKFKIIEFNKGMRKVLASHTSVFKDEENKAVQQSVDHKSFEKSTLGDVEALADLKSKLDKEKKRKK